MQFDQLKRREFISLLGGTAAAWPLAAHAQRSAMPVIGFLSARSPDESAHLVAAFRRGLAETGFIENQNVVIEYRWALSHYDQLAGMAAELVHRQVVVLIAVGGDVAARAAAAASRTIPVITAFGVDPVGSGLVASLARPGGNVTGISNLSATMEAKRIGLLREVVPQATTLGVLLNPNNPTVGNQQKDIEKAARAVGFRVHAVQASTASELDGAFDSIAQNRIPALLVTADAFFTSSRDKLAIMAARDAVPTIYYFRDFAVAGGLMSYGASLAAQCRQIGIYTGHVLKGAKPADLPIVQPTTFEFVINLKTARTLGITLPPGVLAIADEVIE
jgi:putative ABC transport system substrate-binding protein